MGTGFISTRSLGLVSLGLRLLVFVVILILGFTAGFLLRFWSWFFYFYICSPRWVNGGLSLPTEYEIISS